MRTHGETHDCAGCRFWSEMIAQSIGGGPTEALCLSGDGELAGKYVSARQSCEAWKSGHLGAVDDPPNYGEFTRAAYAAEEPCKVHCTDCEGQDHHWAYYGDEDEAGDPALSCKHCEARKAEDENEDTEEAAF